MFGRKKKAEAIENTDTEEVNTSGVTEAEVKSDNDSEMTEEIGVAQEKKKAHAYRGVSYYFTGSFFMHLITLISDAFYNALSSGFFGRLLGSYKKEQNAFEHGYISERLFGNNKVKSYARRARGSLAEGFENSFLLNFTRRSVNALLATPVRNYGNFLLSFGLYTVFAYFANQFLNNSADATAGVFLTGSITVLSAIPLLMTRDSLAHVLGQSASARALLCDVFGFRDESFEVETKQSKLKANLSIFFGMASGLLTFFVHPIVIPITLLVAVTVALIIVTPEIGVILSIFLMPFFSFFPNPSIAIASMTVISAVGYVIKLIRGKRIFKMELVDAALLGFTVLVFFSGLISAGGRASLYEALLACILISVYFLIANMMRTSKWIQKCLLALVSSATVVAVVGVVEYFFGDISTVWLDTTYFEDIKGRVVSLFDNSNVLAFYLVMVFPFALALFERCKLKREKFLALFSVLSIILCVVFTWSRGAWIGILAELVIYLLIRTRKTVRLIFAALLTVPMLPMILPDSIIKRFLSIGDLSDSSTYYRVLTWKGSLRAFGENMLGGIGYGNATFEKVYPEYSYAGIEAAEHTHNLFLQIALGMGVIGLVIFLVVIFLFAQKSFGFVKGAEKDKNVNVTAAAMTSVAAALVMGMFDYIWYNNRILFLFFAVMGIACAAIRIGEEAEIRRQIETVNDRTCASIDIEI